MGAPSRSGRGLDAGSRRSLAEFYGWALRRFGPEHTMSVWWGSPRTQRARFHVLAEAGPWQGASVADVGCGLGDLFGFLEERGLAVRYTGLDISPDMLAAARAKYPHPRAVFHRRDVAAQGLPGRYDYVVASGTFNIRVRQHERYLRRAVEAMYQACRRAAAFNLLTPIPPDHPEAEAVEKLYGRGFFQHMAVEPVAAWCRRLARRVEVRTGYLDWDATVLLFR